MNQPRPFPFAPPDNESRLRLQLNQLIWMTADWYWEQDSEFRFTGMRLADGSAMDPVLLEAAVGRCRWDLAEAAPLSGDWSEHRADCEAHRPFREFVYSRTAPNGEIAYYCIGGQPTYDSCGRFTGYWGVGRDVTKETTASQTLSASESRFREMFSRAPSPFIIHRRGRGLLANPAAAKLYGYSSPEEMIGLDMLDLNHPSTREVSAQRFVKMESLPLGGVVPMTELRSRRKDGTDLFVLATIVRIELPDGPANMSICIDLTERRAAEAALAAAKEAAEAASHAKSAFLANTSHEIRTPLNGLLGLARLAADPKLPEVRRLDYLERIVECGEQLAELISGILDLSKIEAGRLTIEQVDFDLHRLIKWVQHTYGELVTEKRLDFDVTVDPALPQFVRGDPVRVRQIVGNFVSNAIKFTEHGRVGLAAEVLGGDRVRFTVTDTGIGLDSVTLQRLFKPFTQADESTTRRFGGTGLGLSICRQLAELMNGSVGVESTLGVGSKFWAELTLPKAQKSDVEDSVDAADDGLLTDVRVLLVEDNDVNMMIADVWLTSWGVQVVKACDGRQAIEAVERELAAGARLDAVLMDLHMPVMSGHDATIELRKRYSKEQLPIIALTAAALSSEQQQSLDIGMNDFVTKPIDLQRLRAALVKWARVGTRTTG